MPKVSDPTRRSMQFHDWPSADRIAWLQAVTPGSLLDGGLACDWRQATIQTQLWAYGRFLTFLDVTGRLDPASEPFSRITRDVVIEYVEGLSRDCASTTVHQYLSGMARVLHVMAPEVDLEWLKRLVARLEARATPTRNKRSKVVPAEALLDLGLRLMASAWPNDGRTFPARRLVRYRDGLLVAFLSVEPARCRTLLSMLVDHHLFRQGDLFHLRFEREDLKSGRTRETVLPAFLTEAMERYLECVRPQLLAGARCQHLWVALGGGPLQRSSLAQQLKKTTMKEFGVPLGPHMFRDCVATTVAIHDPSHIGIVAPLLEHSSMQPGEQHYNQAGTIDAATEFQDTIRAKRRVIRREKSRKPRK